MLPHHTGSPRLGRTGETLLFSKQGVSEVKLKRTDLYIIVTINDVDFYFNRETLDYDGMGSIVKDGDVSMGFIKKKKDLVEE